MKIETLEDFASKAEYIAYLQEFINECGREIASVEALRELAEERLVQICFTEDNPKQTYDEDIYIGEVIR